MNKTLADSGKKILKDLLSKCTESEQLMFKRMYCHENLDYSIEMAVEQMDEDKISNAITQCERTLDKKN